ncbi:Pyrimidine dimer DNA glycosylase [compost metagenome]
MGTGHVYFMYDKLGYITSRYYALCDEAKNRGFKVNPIEKESLTSGIDSWWFNDYTPTENAVKINRERIKERLDAIS